jgi:hypothetical protein
MYKSFKYFVFVWKSSRREDKQKPFVNVRLPPPIADKTKVNFMVTQMYLGNPLLKNNFTLHLTTVFTARKNNTK